jgi:mRNA interferase YafQ
MLKQEKSNKFDREVIKQIKRGKDIEKLIAVMDLIIEQKPFEKRHHDHPLSGNWAGFRDCHIEPDWLLIYKIEGDTVTFARTGTHSDLF